MTSGAKSIYQLIDRQDGSLSEFLQSIEKLQEDRLIKIEQGKAVLTEKGRDFCNQNKCQDIGTWDCSQCQSTGIELTGLFKEIKSTFFDILKDRPSADKVYDQGFISPEGVLRRVAFMEARGDLYGNLLILGDDDFLSLAVALTGLPNQIRVLEVDPRINEFINQAAQDYNLPVQALSYDVQSELSSDLVKSFDCFLTDPVETLPGIELFLSRGVSGLKGQGCTAYFGLTTLEASRRKWYDIQTKIQSMGFVITDIIRRFSCYPEDIKNFFQYQNDLPIVRSLGYKVDYDWYKSSFFRLEAVQDPEPLVQGPRQLDEKIYKDSESLATAY